MASILKIDFWLLLQFRLSDWAEIWYGASEQPVDGTTRCSTQLVKVIQVSDLRPIGPLVCICYIDLLL